MSATSHGFYKPLNKSAPPILIDRSLGPKLANGLCAVGYQAVHLDDLMPAPPGTFVPDEVWLEHVGRNGWIALCVNPHMVRMPSEVATIREHGARVFSLGSVRATEDMKHFTFGRWWVSIMRRAQRGDACLWRLYIDRPTIKKIP